MAFQGRSILARDTYTYFSKSLKVSFQTHTTHYCIDQCIDLKHYYYSVMKHQC